MTWSPTRLLANMMDRTQTRLMVKDPHIRATMLAASAQNSAHGWTGEAYVGLSRPVLSEISHLDTKFAPMTQAALRVQGDANVRAAVYRQALVAVSMNFRGSPDEVANLVASLAMRGLPPAGQEAVRRAFEPGR